MSKGKLDAKTFAQNKRRRREWLTFVRMVRYGINNFSRNAWLTVAATAVMTITLLIIFTTVAARQVMTETITKIRDDIEMSIYVKNDTSDKDANVLIGGLKELKTVKTASYISPKEARENYAEQNKANPGILKALNEGIIIFPGTLRVTLIDINNVSELQNFVKNDSLMQQQKDVREPSFGGKEKDTIKKIGGWLSFAERIGLIAGAVFVAISSVIVFNTIRMAIFTRKEEIQMMKLIGADKSFIRGPFLVEAIMYGFFASLFATGIGMTGLILSQERLAREGIAMEHTVQFVTIFAPFVLLVMILLGAAIGIVSSLLATRKYLRI